MSFILVIMIVNISLLKKQCAGALQVLLLLKNVVFFSKGLLEKSSTDPMESNVCVFVFANF